MNKETKEIIEVMIRDQKVRRSIAKENHLLFFSAYFGHYMEYEFADFHREMFELSSDENLRTLVITAARGIGKSTILNMSLAIWSILGKPQKKFIVILSHTQTKARQHYTNLRKEFEENKLLKSDLGPFREDSGEWGSSLVLPLYEARITFASTEQSIRGMRHKQHRPDLIIADDLEDNDSVKTLDNRNKTYDWLTKDIIPAGETNTKLVVIGTLLHEDSVLMRLKKEILEGRRTGVYREYPLIDDKGVILWKSKYPNDTAIEAERLRIGDEKSWYQEYLLKIVSDADRVIHPEWIQYYDKMLEKTDINRYYGIRIGIDPAFSENSRADNTAMVSVAVFNSGDDIKIYVLPNSVNERMVFPALLERAKLLSSTHSHNDRKAKLYIESTQAQKGLVDMLEHEWYPVEGVPPQGDKRSRIAITGSAIKEGKVLFPERGAEELILQLINFGIERYDDLADAFALVVGEILKSNVKIRHLSDLKCYDDDDEDDDSKPFTAGLLRKQF
jgi:predicted phage terminase large subunit-like protein